MSTKPKALACWHDKPSMALSTYHETLYRLPSGRYVIDWKDSAGIIQRYPRTEAQVKAWLKNRRFDLSLEEILAKQRD